LNVISPGCNVNEPVVASTNGFNLNGESVTTTAFDADKFKLLAEYIVGVPPDPIEIDCAVNSPEADIVLSNVAGTFTRKLPTKSAPTSVDSIDAENDQLLLKVSEDEIAHRISKWVNLAKTPEKGVLSKFAKSVKSASLGAVTD
jgi:hypothetical protein